MNRWWHRGLILVTALGVLLTSARAQSAAAQRGALLLDRLSCRACHHAPSAGLDPALPSTESRRAAPTLHGLGARMSSAWLVEYLRAPHEVDADTTMPDVLPRASNERRATIAAELAQFLLHGQAVPVTPIESNWSSTTADRGRVLFDTIGCRACHQLPGDRGGRTRDVLPQLGAKTWLPALRDFLLDPMASHPAHPDFRLDEADATAIAMHLLRDQLVASEPALDDGIPREANAAGLRFELFHTAALSALPDFAGLAAPLGTGIVETVRADVPDRQVDDQFALRLSGSLRVAHGGVWQFELESDDGARLSIDGTSMIVNDGIHPPTSARGSRHLDAGDHAIEIEYFEAAGGELLALRWAAPGASEFEPVPPSALTSRRGPILRATLSADWVTDPDAARRGALHYVELGCVMCHGPIPGIPGTNATLVDTSGVGGVRQAAPLSELAQTSLDRHCLSLAPTVDYRLTEDARETIRAALRVAEQAEPREWTTTRALALHGCLACHGRADEAPDDTVFSTLESVDLGDEARLPPALDGVGAKLRPTALRAIIASGAHAIRSRYLATRMPSFGDSLAQGLSDLLIETDLPQPAEQRSPTFDAKHVAVGRRLVGIEGMACVTCHDVNGHRSPAIRGVDLVTAYPRLRDAWAIAYLRAPHRYRPGTRMPAMWGDGESSPQRELLGGSSSAQIDAVWAYLSLGVAMAAPDGALPPSGRQPAELVPIDEPILHRTFVRGVGPRSIVVGHPGLVHVAFDANAVALALAWRGRFFDASGVASGRTDTFLGPLGEAVIGLPMPAFAQLDDPAAPWPRVARGARDVGGEFGGYRFDASRVPTFVYRYRGITIEETPVPRIAAGGVGLLRRFVLRFGAASPAVSMLAWRATSIVRTGTSTVAAEESQWQATDARIRVHGASGATRVAPAVAGEPTTQELLIELAPGQSRQRVFEVEVYW